MKFRVIRGGSYRDVGQSSQVLRLFEIGSERSYFIRDQTMGTLYLRTTYRGWVEPELRYWRYGFRIVVIRRRKP